MCSIEGCDAKPVAKGLCAKHYMRQRRTGDPMKTSGPGRPKMNDTSATIIREMFRDLGKRTQDRQIRASRILCACGGQEALEAAILKASRPNGSLNFSLLERLADSALLKALRT